MATILILVFIGIYLLFKLRKGKENSGAFSFFSGNRMQNHSSDNMINLWLLQQFLNQQTPIANDNQLYLEHELNEHQTYIKKLKDEVIKLLNK